MACSWDKLPLFNDKGLSGSVDRLLLETEVRVKDGRVVAVALCVVVTDVELTVDLDADVNVPPQSSSTHLYTHND